MRRVEVTPAPHPPTRAYRLPIPLGESARARVDGPAIVIGGGMPATVVHEGARAEFAGAVLASVVGADGRRCDVLGWRML